MISVQYVCTVSLLSLHCRHVKFLLMSQMFKNWNAQWLFVVMFMVSFMTSWNCLRLVGSHLTRTTCLWEIMWIVDTTAWRLLHCWFHWRFLLHLLVIPAKARDYVFTGVGLSVCLSVCLFVCYHDNKIKRGRIWTKFFGKVPRGKSKPKFLFSYDR